MMEDYMQKWLNDNMVPSAIVFSSEPAKAAIGKNNLTPSEFLRPFGDYKGLCFSLVFCDIFATVLDSFRLDFFDCDAFERKKDLEISKYILSAISNPKLIPSWSLNSPLISKKSTEPILSNVVNHSFPWYHEAEKTFLELTQFNEVEMLQQPFLFVYVCLLTDPPAIINELKEKQMPKLITEGIYEANMVNLILLLNDKSSKDGYAEAKDVDSYANSFQKAYQTYPLIVLDINTQDAEDASLLKDDIWEKYIHKVDLYNPQLKDGSSAETRPIRGRFISNRERDSNKLKFVTFMTDVLKPNMLNIIKELDDEVTAKRKNAWKSFQKLFQAPNKAEDSHQLNSFQVYKLSPIEKKLYLLSIIQFYFHDYLDACKNLELLHEDLRKSKRHQNGIMQLITICQFMLKENKRKVDIEAPYKGFNLSYDYQSAFRALIIQIKMMEHIKAYSEICPVIIQASVNSIYPFMKPLMVEKSAIYYLLIGNFRQFSKNMLLAGELFKADTSEQYQTYAVKCYGALMHFFNRIDHSFARLKLHINQEMSSLCAKASFNEAAVVFSKNCVETLKYYPQTNQVQSDFFKQFLKSLYALNNQTPLKELSIIDIDNSSVFIVEGQDELIYSSVPRDTGVSFENFAKYTKVYVQPKYIPLTKNDMKAFNFLDCILSRKVITNYYVKRHYNINSAEKVYVKLAMQNPFDIAIEVKSFRLLYETQSEQPLSKEEDIVNESIDFVIEENAKKELQLSFAMRKPGNVVIKGVEMKLFGVASVVHLFSLQKMNSLYEYHYKRREDLASLKTSLKATPSQKGDTVQQKKDFTLGVIDVNSDFSVLFPMTQDVTVYCNELLMMPIVLSNRTGLQVTKFTVYLYDTSEEEKKNRSVLCDYIHTVDWNIAKENREVIVPIVPLAVGTVCIKVVVKFEDECTFKELEAKRFVVKLNVIPSIEIDVKEKLLFWNDDHIDFSVKANAHIINRSKLSLLEIDSMYIKPQFQFIEEGAKISNNSPGKDNWSKIRQDAYAKLYSDFKIRKTLGKDHSKDRGPQPSCSFISTAHHSSQPQKHIDNAFSQLIADDHLIVHWTTKEEGERMISGVLIHKLALKMPTMDSDSLHSLLGNLVELNVEQEREEDNATFVTLNYSIQVKPIEDLRNFLSFNAEVDESAKAFDWVGLKRFTYSPSLLRKFVDNSGRISISFTFMTHLRGVIDINRVFFNFYFSDNPGQAVTVLKVPHFRTLAIK